VSVCLLVRVFDREDVNLQTPKQMLNDILCTCTYPLVGTTVEASQCGVSWASKLGGAHPSPSLQ